MALKKTLSQRIFSLSKIPTQSFTNPARYSPTPGDNGVFRRFLHRTSMFNPANLPEIRSLTMGDLVMERLRGMDIARRERIRLEGLTPPAPEAKHGLTVRDAKKLMRVAQVEAVKSKLRGNDKSCISYPEFVRICGENCDQGVEIAKALDESGSVIVLGNTVYLRPDQVVRAMEEVLQLPGASPSELKMKELEEMEEVKFVIDRKAESLVRGELWCGLGFLMLQTAGFMRLTFWELSWDVMEPICFYVTSLYFMMGYTFFLRTSREPSFQGFFQSRFLAKQKRLMKKHNFDMDKYVELRRACGLKSWSGPEWDNVSKMPKMQY